MAKTSEFRLSNLRKPGHWRAAITPKGRTGNVGGETVRSVVTPNGSSRTICFLVHRRSVAAPLISCVLGMAIRPLRDIACRGRDKFCDRVVLVVRSLGSRCPHTQGSQPLLV